MNDKNGGRVEILAFSFSSVAASYLASGEREEAEGGGGGGEKMSENWKPGNGSSRRSCGEVR